MRTIKFRAWDQHEKKMWNKNNIVVGDGVFLYRTHNIDTLVHEYELRNDLIPLQFTGLLDKNGKEIYEGDIVFDEDGEYSKTCIIEWNDESGGFFGKSIYDNDSYSMVEIDGEIIGNIYENRNLLK